MSQEVLILLSLLDARLSQHAFIAGDAFTMADIPIACEIHRWHGLPLKRPERPNLDRWSIGVTPGRQSITVTTAASPAPLIVGSGTKATPGSHRSKKRGGVMLWK